MRIKGLYVQFKYKYCSSWVFFYLETIALFGTCKFTIEGEY